MSDSRIRLARGDDAAQIAAIYDPVVRDTVISFEVEPPGADEIRRRIGYTLEALPWLVWDESGRVLGYAYASRHRERQAYQWSVDVSCYVHESARRRGIGKRLYEVLMKVLARQGYHGAFAGITLPNPASIALHESVGFERIATYREVGYKLGGWRDVAWWQARLGEAGADPPPPRAFPLLGPGILDQL